jgi:hypothetical protein
MLRTRSLKMFNSIGAIGLLVLAGVLLTTATAPAGDWRVSPDTGYLLVQPDSRQASVPPRETLPLSR